MRMFFSLAAVTLLAVAVSADATASTVNESNAPKATGAAEAGATSPDARKLSEALIYSVDRTPESPFDTPRAVEVITIDDIRRKSGMSLSDVLEKRSDAEVVSFVRSTPGAIGYVSEAAATDGVRVVPVN